MTAKTISVIVPNYNHGHYIGEALESLLSQSLRPSEVIVIDDASTDNSIEIIENFVRKDPIVRLVRNESNLGAAISANRALDHVTGQYVYAMAADDRISPTLMEKSVNLLEQHPQAGLCSADMDYIDAEGKSIGDEYRAAAIADAAYLSPAEVLAELYRNPNYIIGGTTIFRRAALDEIGGFSPELLSLTDWFAERAIALKWGACYIPEILFSWRNTGSNYSDACFKDPERMFVAISRTVELMRSPEYRERFPSPFVEFWSSWYGQQVVDAASEQLGRDRFTFMENLGRYMATGVISRGLKRVLWSMTGLGWAVSKRALQKRLNAAIR